ncbi:MAG: hypothetical protein ACI835_002856 [Planctomycetota bacterium]|jgi:hypothetical protein
MKDFQQISRPLTASGLQPLLAVLAFVAAASPIMGQEVSQERQDEQDKRIDELEETLFALEDRSYERILGSVEIHGFLAQGYMNSSHNNYLTRSEQGSWAFNELGVNFSVDLTDKTRAGIQLFSRDLGPIGNNEVVIDWAFLDYHYSDKLGFRFGKVKAPHGLYNETRDVDLLRNSILLPSSVYNESYRTSMAGLWGVGTYGGFSSDTLGRLDYQATIGTVDIGEEDGIARSIESVAPMDVNGVEMDETISAGLRWSTPLEGLLLGVTYLETDISATGDLTVPLGGPLVAGTPLVYNLDSGRYSVFSAEYTISDLILAAEYWTSTLESTVTADASGTPVLLSDTKLHQEGYYVSAAQRMNEWLEFGAYYSVHYPNSDDKSGDAHVAVGDPNYKAWMKDLALTVRFDIDDSWVFKIEGHTIDGVGPLYDSDNLGGYDRRWTMLVVKLSVSF